MNYIKAFTHSGVFHADDVMSSAFLKLLNPEIKIERGFKVPDNYDGLVFDIGFDEFDHHQPDNDVRENGIPYAAFGKLWRKFSPELGLSKKSLDIIEESIVQPVDNTDNTGNHNPLSAIIGYFNPEWNSDEVADDNFEDAVEFALLALKKVIKHFKAVEEADRQAKEAISKMTSNGIIILDKFIPLSCFEEEENAKLVVFPSLRGGYNVNCIRGHFELPKEWRGISVEKAKELGLKGLTFCHVGGFILAAETKEDAIALAEKAIEIVDPAAKKYELTNDTIEHYGTVLHRIKALKDFGIVKAGELGGYIESEDNLSHEGDCWVFDEAVVKGKAKVLDNAKAEGNAQVSAYAIVKNYGTVAGNAIVTGHSKVYEIGIIFGNATMNEKCELFGCATVTGNAALHSSTKVYGTAVVGGNTVATNATIYDAATVMGSTIIGATVNGNSVIDTDVYLKDNAYITSVADYVNITMNGITVTFYLSKDKEMYFVFGGYEHKLSALDSYERELSDNTAFPNMVKLAKKYLLKGEEYGLSRDYRCSY